MAERVRVCPKLQYRITHQLFPFVWVGPRRDGEVVGAARGRSVGEEILRREETLGELGAQVVEGGIRHGGGRGEG